METFLVEFYEQENGERPVEDFLNSLDIKMRSKLLSRWKNNLNKWVYKENTKNTEK